MVEIFYKSGGKIVTSDAVGILDKLGLDDVVWIDLFSPGGEEKRSVEDFLDTTIQSRATAEEIESSSRYSETDTTVYANTNFMIPAPEKYTMESVSFIIHEGIMVSVRTAPLRSFTDIQRKLISSYRSFPTGYHVLVGILENRIDMDADMIELMSKEIAQYSKRVSLGENVGEEFLLDINRLQENTMMVRENIVDKQRMITSIIRSDKFPRDVQSKMNILLKDVSSLINHTNFSFERLEYLQNTVLGLINLEQNKIMKVFTFVSLLLMPPTLIASIYGMNIKLPTVGGMWDFMILALVMVISVLCSVLIFKHRKMM
ncbi:MAG: magnesium and cobalt transport protein CorA [Bacteroidales bacterium]|jgi:magnesium transporter|nr:magnesium and cobalt transport protein CorA [Bacteroidales bacterium]MCI2121222.1 magnesium and cobalt transport protein CorA [Bacteroidales bacterium]MCI2145988.1 magnesium and cobalt transport protein CorA [Bacteroidales bacterium]